VTIQPLWKLHDACAQQDRAPNAAELAATCELVDWRKLEVSAGAIRLDRAGTAVTLNGIAQGFAADQVLAVLKKHGVEQALINTGELGSLGQKPGGQPWRVGIQHPRHEDAYAAFANLDGRCLATSGDYASTFGGDRERHHLLDPDTGASAREFASVSIVAPTGMLADGLSTSVFVLGVELGAQLIEATAGADLFAILQNGRTFRTPGFPCADVEADS
jgi:thiamine biosynthesis lipoprotein